MAECDSDEASQHQCVSKSMNVEYVCQMALGVIIAKVSRGRKGMGEIGKE